MAKYPLYLELGGKGAIVIGAGTIGARKVKSLCDVGANVTVITKEVQGDFAEYCKGLDFELRIEGYSKQHLEGTVIAIASTNNTKLNREIYDDCHALGVLCNVVDVPDLCDFYVPALVTRGSLQIAIGTDGQSPAYAGYVRRKLEEMFTEDHGRFVDELGSIRKTVIEKLQPEDRKPALQELVKDESFDIFVRKGKDAWLEMADEVIGRYVR
jgi:precorrin-2 dehydrogenase/sirohydrochlorin ferrochelatase